MANQLRMATVQTILTLRRRRWSYRRIARELGIHRETVARHVRLDREGVILPHVPPASRPVASLENPLQLTPRFPYHGAVGRKIYSFPHQFIATR